MPRERDWAYEALATATNSDMSVNRGELNKALALIKEQCELRDTALATEIHRRARLYGQVMEDTIITAPALAKHWLRVEAEAAKPPRSTNQAVNKTCPACGGDRFVVYSVRSPDKIEEMAPCPLCNAVEISFFRPDGTKLRTPDPARVREMLGL